MTDLGLADFVETRARGEVGNAIGSVTAVLCAVKMYRRLDGRFDAATAVALEAVHSLLCAFAAAYEADPEYQPAWRISG